MEMLLLILVDDVDYIVAVDESSDELTITRADGEECYASHEVVEVKTEGGRVSALQRHTHKAMQRLGLDVRLVWSKLDVEVLVNELCGA